MGLEQIKEIIKSNPQLSYEQMKQQAIQAGITPDMFEQAWKELNQKISGKIFRGGAFPNLSEAHLLIMLISIGLIASEISYWAIRYNKNALASIFIIFAIFGIGTSALFFLLRSFGSDTKFTTITIVSIILSIVDVLVGNEGMMFFGKYIVVLLVFLFIFKISFIRSIFVSILYTLITVGVLYLIGYVNDLIFTIVT